MLQKQVPVCEFQIARQGQRLLVERLIRTKKNFPLDAGVFQAVVNAIGHMGQSRAVAHPAEIFLGQGKIEPDIGHKIGHFQKIDLASHSIALENCNPASAIKVATEGVPVLIPKPLWDASNTLIPTWLKDIASESKESEDSLPP